jgi:hypothetical protein
MTRITDQLASVVAQYHSQSLDAAAAESAHKKARAKRFLEAMHSGEAKSAVMADNIAEADDLVADLYSKRLVTAALADATKQKILSLREEIGMLRTQMANERELDRLHSTDRGVS